MSEFLVPGEKCARCISHTHMYRVRHDSRVMTATCALCGEWRPIALRDDERPESGLACLEIHIDHTERGRIDRGPYIVTEYYDADLLDVVRNPIVRVTGFRIWQSTLDLHLVIKMAEAWMTDRLVMPAAIRIERNDQTIFAASWDVPRLTESGERVSSPLSVPLF